METKATCEECGSEITVGALSGQCPKCLMAIGFEEAEATRARPLGKTLRRLKDYELIDQIGLGGMGAVYRAWQTSLKRTVALKMILPANATKPEAIRRFQIEAEASAKLQHPNIVPIYEIGDEDGDCYFSMQLIEGSNLKECMSAFRLEREEAIPSALAARAQQEKIAGLISKVAAAVHFAHERGILHRDLKPKNILINERGEPFLTDFGLAKVFDGEESITETDAVLGTLNYMAPEQAAGRRISRGADIFSLGAILYELLTGVLPFRGTTPAETLRQLTDQDPTDARTINKWIDSDLGVICLKCLQKNPRERYATAEELQRDLERWSRSEPIEARPISRAVRIRRWARRNPVVTGLMGTLMIGLGTTLLFLFIIMRHKAAKERALDALRERVSADIYAMWSPRGATEITSEQLAVVFGSEPTAVSKPLRLKLGVFVHQNPMETVKQYHPLITHLERTMTAELGQAVRFNLCLYKELTLESLIREPTDFMRVSPLFYAEALRLGRALHPVVRPANPTFRCVIFARKGIGITKLEDLPGRSLIFAEENSLVTFEAQRLLGAAGVLRTNLSRCEYFKTASASEYTKGGYFSMSSEPLKAVISGRYDAGVGLDRQFLQNQHRDKLIPLITFDCMDQFWAAADRTETHVMKAFSKAMRAVDQSAALQSLPEDPQRVQGFVEASPGDYESIQAGWRQAAIFNEPKSENRGH